jgi:hypothetical protein
MLPRDIPLTFAGALQILGRHDRPWLDRLDRFLGGAILAAGAAGAAWGSPLFGAAIAGGLWSAVGQKNEAMGLLRRALDNLSDRLTGVSTYERTELITAARTTLVVASFFEVLNERADDANADRLRLQRSKVVALVEGGRGTTIGRLLQTALPAPSAAAGFWENARNLEETKLLTWILELGEEDYVDLIGVAILVGENRELLQVLPRLSDPAFYSRSLPSRLLLRAFAAEQGVRQSSELTRLAERLSFDDLFSPWESVAPPVIDSLVLRTWRDLGFAGPDLNVTVRTIPWPRTDHGEQTQPPPV